MKVTKPYVRLTQRTVEQLVDDATICAAAVKLCIDSSSRSRHRAILAADRILKRFVHTPAEKGSPS